MPYDNTDSGALFKNDRKPMIDGKPDPDSKLPDYTGTVNVGGVELRLAGWIRQSKAGKPFLSLKVSPKEGGPRTAATRDPNW